jgi:hypothetical protein
VDAGIVRRADELDMLSLVTVTIGGMGMTLDISAFSLLRRIYV